MQSEENLIPPKDRPGVWRYILAVILIAVAGVIRQMSTSVNHELPLVGMSFAVFFAAYFGGVGPGLLATGLAVLIGAFIAKPTGSPKVESLVDEVRLVSFLALGTLISLLSERARRLQARAAANELALSQSRYLTMIYQSSDPIVVLKGGIITVVNTQLVYLLGPIRRLGLLGQPFLDFVHPDDKPLVSVWLSQLRPGLTKAPARLRFVSLAGNVIEAAIALEIFDSATGQTVQITFSEARTVLLSEPAASSPARSAEVAVN